MECRSAVLTRATGLVFLSLGAFLSACASSGVADRGGATPSEEELVAGMQIVDCLLPGQLRKLGNSTYLTPRRPIKTTASDCNIRGGEYVAYDRANYKTALSVWMPAAEAGDAEAQVAVGEIFERGLGTEPNYQAAAIWYEKAAEQNNRRGQFNLGTLYEQGLGVEKDKARALNLYRQAWGLPADSLILKEAAQQQQQALRESLQKKLDARDAQLRALERQIKALNQSLNAAEIEKGSEPAKRQPKLEKERESLTELASALRRDRSEIKKELSTIPKLRTPAVNSAEGVVASKPDENAELSSKDLKFGRYYALIIGNRNYAALEDLETPINDARQLADILEKQYGFNVQLLLDADRVTVMQAINELHEILGENDNLLLYYAGHGSLVEVGERDAGYWLPVNADPPPNDAFWVSNEFVTNHLGRIKAKRVLVVADSCYGGLLSSSPGHLFLGTGRSGASQDPEYIRYKLPRRSRLLLSSGGDKPVIDTGGDGHSVFARELIEALKSNKAILSAPDLFLKVSEPVKARAAASDFVQVPVYKSIKGAGHEVGDFFFVPQ